MSYTPGYGVPIPPMVGTFNYGLALESELLYSSLPASAAPSGAVIYIPVMLPSPCVVRRVWFVSGATTTGGATIQVGVYDSGPGEYKPRNRLVYGSATQANVPNSIQFIDVTDTYLPPGLYWLAIVPSTTVNTTIMRSAGSDSFDASHRMQETGTTLPATATPVESAGGAYMQYGFSTTSGPA